MDVVLYGHSRLWLFVLSLHINYVPVYSIITDVVGSTPAQGKVYNIMW